MHFFDFEFIKIDNNFELKKKANFQHSKQVKIPKTSEKKGNKVNSQKIKMVL
mgnify:CR=1 FL=1